MNVITMVGDRRHALPRRPVGPVARVPLEHRIRERVADANLLVHGEGAGVAVRHGCGLRASLPRMRYDRLMALGWKYLIEIAILWVLVSTALPRRARPGLALVRRGAGFRRDRDRGVRHAVPRDAESRRVRRGVPLMGRLSGFRVTLAADVQAAPHDRVPKVKLEKPERLHGRHVSTATRTA